MSNPRDEEVLEWLSNFFADLNTLSETNFTPDLFHKNVKNLLKRERPEAFAETLKSKGLYVPKIK